MMFAKNNKTISFALIVIALTLNACASEKQEFENGYADKYYACKENPNPNPYNIKAEFDYNSARCKCNNNEPCERGMVCGLYGQCEGIREKCDHSTCDYDSTLQTNTIRLCDTQTDSADSKSTGNVIAKYNCPNNTICNSSGDGCIVPCSGEEFRCLDNNHYQKCQSPLWGETQECTGDLICNPNGGNICITTCEENAEFCNTDKNEKYICQNNKWKFLNEPCEKNKCSDGTFTCEDGEIKICVNGSLISQTPKEQCEECISISTPTSDGYNRLFDKFICKQCTSGSICNTNTNKYDECINGLYIPTNKVCDSTSSDDPNPCSDQKNKCDNNKLIICDDGSKKTIDCKDGCCYNNKAYQCNNNTLILSKQNGCNKDETAYLYCESDKLQTINCTDGCNKTKASQFSGSNPTEKDVCSEPIGGGCPDNTYKYEKGILYFCEDGFLSKCTFVLNDNEKSIRCNEDKQENAPQITVKEFSCKLNEKANKLSFTGDMSTDSSCSSDTGGNCSNMSIVIDDKGICESIESIADVQSFCNIEFTNLQLDNSTDTICVNIKDDQDIKKGYLIDLDQGSCARVNKCTGECKSPFETCELASDECTNGAKQCQGTGNYQTCINGKWGNKEGVAGESDLCPPGESCTADACKPPSTTDSCVDGEIKCRPGEFYKCEKENWVMIEWNEIEQEEKGYSCQRKDDYIYYYCKDGNTDNSVGSLEKMCDQKCQDDTYKCIYKNKVVKCTDSVWEDETDAKICEDHIFYHCALEDLIDDRDLHHCNDHFYRCSNSEFQLCPWSNADTCANNRCEKANSNLNVLYIKYVDNNNYQLYNACNESNLLTTCNKLVLMFEEYGKLEKDICSTSNAPNFTTTLLSGCQDNISSALSDDSYYIYYYIPNQKNKPTMQFKVSSENDPNNPEQFIINLSYPSK